ncbi:MAG: hypothetical protein R2867_35515 [Caldilineaceae bacterium]
MAEEIPDKNLFMICDALEESAPLRSPPATMCALAAGRNSTFGKPSISTIRQPQPPTVPI